MWSRLTLNEMWLDTGIKFEHVEEYSMRSNSLHGYARNLQILGQYQGENIACEKYHLSQFANVRVIRHLAKNC
jgi:hypothetical protein